MTTRSRVAALVLCALWIPPRATAQDGTPAPTKRYFPACQRFSAQLIFDCYRDFSEVERFLRDAAEQHPGLASLESIGKSYQGRDLWVLTIMS